MSIDFSRGARTLRCTADGRVIPLNELCDGVYSHRLKGDGFAVRLRKRGTEPQGDSFGASLKRLLWQLIQPSEYVEIVAPTDGVVTSLADGLSLRTGDGVSVTVFTEAETGFLPQVGEKVRRGSTICVATREELQGSALGGAIAVLFTQPQQITELHISAGKRRAGDRAAFYRINKR